MVKIKDIMLLSGTAALSACAPALQTPLSTNHPASPAASEAPAAMPSATLRNELVDQTGAENSEAPPVDEMDRHQTGQATQSEYRCPMHADVRSDKQGRCPKCGMSLQLEGRKQ